MLRDQVENEFVRITDAWKATYIVESRFYVALHTKDGWEVSYCLVVLGTEMPINNDDIHFQTKSILAGRKSRIVSQEEIQSFISSVVSDQLDFVVDGVRLKFPINQDRLNAFFHLKNHRDFPADIRIPTLEIAGENLSEAPGADVLDLELYSAPIPYDGVEELMSVIGIQRDPRRTSNSRIDIALRPPAIFVNDTSIKDGELHITIQASSLIDRAQLRVAVKIWTGNEFRREEINSQKIRWQPNDKNLIGKVTMAIDQYSISQCFMSYRDEFTHKVWVTDQSHALNYRAGIYDLFDEGKDSLKRLLFPKDGESRNLERGIALLLSLHGFNAANYGFGKAQNGPDLVVESPSGRIAVIECTTDLPNKNDKLVKLYQRTRKISEYLAKKGHLNREVLGVLFTNLSVSETSIAQEEAAKYQLSLLSMENIESLIERLNLPPDPERLYNEAKQSVPSKQRGKN